MQVKVVKGSVKTASGFHTVGEVFDLPSPDYERLVAAGLVTLQDPEATTIADIKAAADGIKDAADDIKDAVDKSVATAKRNKKKADAEIPES